MSSAGPCGARTDGSQPSLARVAGGARRVSAATVAEAARTRTVLVLPAALCAAVGPRPAR